MKEVCRLKLTPRQPFRSKRRMEEDVDDAAPLWLCVEVVGARNLESDQAVDAYCVVRVGLRGRPGRRRSGFGDDAAEETRDGDDNDDDEQEEEEQEEDAMETDYRGGVAWRSTTASATNDPMWRFRVETRLGDAGDAEADGEEGDEDSELLVVEVFNEKNFFFDMFPDSEAHQDENGEASRHGSSARDSDDASAVASPASTVRSRRRRRHSMSVSDVSRVPSIDLNANDEALGVVELSLALLRRRAVRGVWATDEWHVLRGACSGEVRIRTLLQATRPTEDDEVSKRWEELLVSTTAQVEDHYGFRIPPSSIREWSHLRSYHACREQRRVTEWESTFGSHFFSLPSAQSSSVVKKLAREGIPRHWRQRVYMAMSGGLEKQAKAPKDYYASLVEKIAMQDTVSFRQIELDIDRTFGHSGTKICTEEGRASLRRVLKAYSMHNPTVGYCQGLNFIVGFLTLLLDEESTFWLLAVICEDFYPGYYIPTMTDTQTDMLVLKQLIADELPELDQFTSDVGLPLELLGSQWLLCLFTTTFPAETAFRIFDCIMTEGPHFVFAVIMAHLRRLESTLLGLEEFQAVLSAMKESENALFDADDFIRLAVHEAKHITTERVAQLRDEHSMSVLSEMQRADRARALNRQLAVVYQIPAFSSTAANLLRFFHTEAEMSSRSDVAFVLTLLCHGLVWLAEHSKHLRR